MKLSTIIAGTILVLFIIGDSFCQNRTYNSYAENKKDNSSRSFYEKKSEIIELIKKEIRIKQNISPALDEKEVYLILGISSFAAFVLSITVFKQEIFSGLPLALFGAGVLFTILSN